MVEGSGLYHPSTTFQPAVRRETPVTEELPLGDAAMSRIRKSQNTRCTSPPAKPACASDATISTWGRMAARQAMIDAGCVRTGINRMVGRIRSMFKWAVGARLRPEHDRFRVGIHSRVPQDQAPRQDEDHPEAAPDTVLVPHWHPHQLRHNQGPTCGGNSVSRAVVLFWAMPAPSRPGCTPKKTTKGRGT